MTTSTIAYVPVDTRLRMAAGPGSTLVARSAARRAGVSKSTWYQRIREGRLFPILGEVASFVDVGDPIPREVLIGAAILEAGDGGGPYGATALERLGAWPERRRDDSIHVVSRRSIRPIRDHRITFHRSAERRSAAAAALEAATQLTPHQLTFALRELAYAQLLTIAQFRRFVEARSGHRGVVTARRAIELHDALSAGTKSRSEDRALGPLSAAFGEPVVNVFGAAGVPDYEPDLLWRREMIIVEIDGGPHLDDPVTVARDRERDRILRAAGWIVIRVPWQVTLEMDRVVAELRPVFASRR